MTHEELERERAQLRDSQQVLERARNKMQLLGLSLLFEEPAGAAAGAAAYEHFDTEQIEALEGNVRCALAMVEIVREQRHQLLEAEEAVGSAVSDFRCPLGLQLMREPVMLEDGRSYEKANIEQWFRQQELEEKPASSPVTRTVLQSTQLVVNLNLKNDIVAAVEDMKGQLGKRRPAD